MNNSTNNNIKQQLLSTVYCDQEKQYVGEENPESKNLVTQSLKVLEKLEQVAGGGGRG
jgi:hypothetical protein